MATIDTNISKLIINKMTQAKYEELLAAGQINDNELYITDKTLVDSYSKTESDALLAQKADVATVNSALDTKANADSVYTKDEIDTKTEEINEAITTATGTLEQKITTTEQTLSGQINTLSQTVTEELAKKADKETTYTKTEVNDLLDALDCLPAQADNAGKFLTTNGTTASWGDLPTATNTTAGIVKLATADEVSAGTSTTSVVTVAQLNAVSGGASGAISTLEQKVDGHIADQENPHNVTAEQVGLGNVDNTSDADKPVSTAQQAALDLKANATDVYTKSETYTKEEVDAKVTSVYRFRGSVETFDDLPETGLTVGDVYNVEENGANYAYTEDGWDKLGETIDLTPYLTTEAAAQTYATKELTEITGAASTIVKENLTASRVAISDASGKVAVSDVTTTELAHLSGVTSNVQEQIDAKADATALDAYTTTEELTPLLDAKADKADTYTKTEVDDAIAAVLPDQTGAAGKVLTSDGTNATWQEPVAAIMRVWE